MSTIKSWDAEPCFGPCRGIISLWVMDDQLGVYECDAGLTGAAGGLGHEVLDEGDGSYYTSCVSTLPGGDGCDGWATFPINQPDSTTEADAFPYGLTGYPIERDVLGGHVSSFDVVGQVKAAKAKDTRINLLTATEQFYDIVSGAHSQQEFEDRVDLVKDSAVVAIREVYPERAEVASIDVDSIVIPEWQSRYAKENDAGSVPGPSILVQCGNTTMPYVDYLASETSELVQALDDTGVPGPTDEVACPYPGNHCIDPGYEEEIAEAGPCPMCGGNGRVDYIDYLTYKSTGEIPEGDDDYDGS